MVECLVSGNSEFLAYAYSNWSTCAFIRLIVGDGHYDYKNNYGIGSNYIHCLGELILDW
jgi:hypothetical protein